MLRMAMVGAFAGLALLLALATPAAATPADMIRPGHAPPPPADWAQAPEPESTVTADLSLHGGAIQKAPKVYLVFWGWHGRDPYGEAQQLYDFFSGIGGTGWAATQTQYYDNARGYITNPANQLGGYWIDDTSTPPSFSSFGDIMGEALRAEAHFGYDRDANYFVATPSGHSTNGFGTVFCAWHSSVKDSAGRDVAFTNFPYNLDTGNCGAYSVNGWPGGLLDGVTVVAGHEYAETVTDPVPPTGWHDGTTAGENADKCAWRFSGPGAMANLATSTGTFAVQGMWSNADHGCAIVGNLADLSAALTAPASVLPGFPLTYVATVANHGPHTATAASLVASLPAAFRFTHGTLSQGSCTASPDATVFLCSLGGLATGASATVTFTGTLPTPGAVRGTATAGTASLDLNPGNDAAAAATQVLPPSTDLRATASASTGSTLVGHAVVYMANVTNRGPSDASATTLALQLPPGTYGTLAVTQGSCTRVGMAVTCPLGALATGATASLTIPVTPTAAGALTATATATPSGGAIDPVPTNNRAAATVTARLPAVDLGVSVLDSADPLLAGQPLAYTVNVTNHGPDDAPAVTLSNTLPMGMSYGTAAPSQGACIRSASLLTCQLGALASGATATVVVPMVPTQAGTATDAATATAPGSLDAVAANNRATQATVVRAPVTNLEVTNLDSADPLLVGHPLTYTVTVANHGPDDAPGVTLTDQLPPGAYGNLTATQGSCTRAGAAVTCLLGGMANGTSATLTFPLTPTQAGTATNAASALPTGGAIDPVPANNRASQPTAVRMPSTDLAVTNEDSADPLLAGQTLAYSVVVANHGPDDAPGVTLTDTVPAGMDYGAILTTQGTCTRAATVVTCRLGPLASGGVASIVLPMVPTRAQSALNAASVAPAGALDPVSANNRASATTTVRAPSTDLAVAVADSADPALTGQPLDYRVTVTNNGPDDAPGVTLTDTLPAGMAYGVPLPSQGACTRVGATVTCQLGPLASGASAALALPMVPTAAGIASDRASAVATGGVDPVSANNAVTQSTAIHASSSDLAVTNDAAPGATGGSLVYTVTVTNNGPDDAPAATLTDTLPSGTAYGTPAASQGSCVRSGTTVLCQLGPLANGATATVTLTVTPNGTSATSTASAAVAGGGIDPNGANNRLSRTTAVH